MPRSERTSHANTLTEATARNSERQRHTSIVTALTHGKRHEAAARWLSNSPAFSRLSDKPTSVLLIKFMNDNSANLCPEHAPVALIVKAENELLVLTVARGAQSF
jgi:hypothetical protein